MNYLLRILKRGAAAVVLGEYTLITYNDGTMTVRKSPGGLMGPTVKITRKGLREILNWIDINENFS